MNVRTFSAWALTILAALGFGGSGLMKIIAPAGTSAEFALFGLPLWLATAIGVCEVIGVGMLFTAQRRIGAIILACVGCGAFGEHVTHGQFAMGLVPLSLAAMAVVGTALRTPGFFGVRSPSTTTA